MKDDEVEIPVQINGKTKAVMSISADEAKDAVIAKAKEVLGRSPERHNCQRNLCTGQDCQYCAEIIGYKISQMNRVLGNIEKFAEIQGL